MRPATSCSLRPYIKSVLMKVLVWVASGLNLGYVGCYGNEWVATPTLDRLAAEGIVFDYHYADSPDPAAAKRAWYTGRYTMPPAAEANLDEAINLFARLQGRGVDSYLVTD